jgi:hypothetical protein
MEKMQGMEDGTVSIQIMIERKKKKKRLNRLPITTLRIRGDVAPIVRVC